MFKNASTKELVDFVIKLEKDRAEMDFTIPLFNHLKEVVERESDVRILIKQPDSMLDAEL